MLCKTKYQLLIYLSQAKIKYDKQSWIFKSFSNATATVTAMPLQMPLPVLPTKHGSSNHFPETPRKTLDDH